MGRIIIKNCNVGEVDIPQKWALKLYNDLSIRHPNAFYLRTRARGMANWDGKVKFISARGQFKIGMLPRIVNLLHSYGYKDFRILDERLPIPKVDKSIRSIGEYKLRPEQIKAVESVINNKILGISYPIGVINYTVNAGKSLIMSALYLSFKKKLKTLLITNDADWLRQAKDEFCKYLPNENITYVQGSKVNNWSQFSIGMVQSISRNIKTYQRELSKIDMVLVDEADLANNKMYQSVITHLYNTRVRIGLSGTIYMSKLAKDKLKNFNLESFFGPEIAKFTLKESIKKGYSTNTIVKIVPGKYWYGNYESEYTDYKDLYDDMITNNTRNWQMVLFRLKYNLSYGRVPALVVCKYVKHAENLYTFLKDKLKKYKIACVHVNTPTKERVDIMNKFRSGDIDILISTTIIARGKNFPLLRCMIQASSMDSQEKSIQFLGRLVRTSKTKSRVYLDDLAYPGKYLSRHSRHRKNYYMDQGLKVIDLSKNRHKYSYPI